MQAEQRAVTGILKRATLKKIAAKAGTQHQILGSEAESEDVADGRFQITRYASGVLVHTSDAYELQDMTASIQLPSSIVFSIVLEGCLSFSIGGQSQLISARAGTQYNCFAMNLLRPTLLQRKISKGMKLRKVNISIQHQLLEPYIEESLTQDNQIKNFIEQHLAIPKWLASAKLRELSEQILQAPIYQGVLQELYMQSKALEFVVTSLQSISSLYRYSNIRRNTLKRPALAKANKIKKYLENSLLISDGAEALQSLQQISIDIGISISNMQRLFKSAYGQTIFEYIRQRRLEIARDAIEKKQISISEAAYIAGYKHPSNFATAFKKSFGIPPGTL